jgi:hypothetical protein
VAADTTNEIGPGKGPRRGNDQEMADPIVVTILATVDTPLVLQSDDLGQDSVGLFRELEECSEATIEVRLRGKDLASHRSITAVRSVPTPDFGQGPWTCWQKVNDVYVSPLFSLGDEIRIEIDNSAGAPTVPQGGGHFRVVEEGGGFVLVAVPPAGIDTPRQEASLS